jgi:hypothetical protein
MGSGRGWPSRDEGLARLCSHSYLLKGNFNFATCAVRCVDEINPPSKLVRDQIAYQAGAIAGWNLSLHWGAAKLTPLEQQLRARIQVYPVPRYAYPPVG